MNDTPMPTEVLETIGLLRAYAIKVKYLREALPTAKRDDAGPFGHDALVIELGCVIADIAETFTAFGEMMARLLIPEISVVTGEVVEELAEELTCRTLG